MNTSFRESLTIKKSYPAPVAGFLSYLVPGLGQIVQGRIAKGVLFLVCLYGLFFYGMYLGHWQNVLVSTEPRQPNNMLSTPTTPVRYIWHRARFIAQVWIGVAAWPAVIQHMSRSDADGGHTLFGNYQRPPTEEQMLVLLRENDKSIDLGWVYTVIAGVLNLLVIYDAYAGPIQSASPRTDKKNEENAEEPNP